MHLPRVPIRPGTNPEVGSFSEQYLIGYCTNPIGLRLSGSLILLAHW